MKDHFELTDNEFERRFADKELEPYAFSHEAHLRLVWIHIDKYGPLQGEKNVQEQIQSYVEFVGAHNKYHVTLTVAAIKAIHHFMSKSKSVNFREFIAEFPELKTNFKTLIASHYSFDIFQSEKAKTQYIEPDLMPF